MDIPAWLFIAGLVACVLVYLVAYLWGHHVGIHKGREWGAAEEYIRATEFFTDPDTIAGIDTMIVCRKAEIKGTVFGHDYLELYPPKEG